MSTATTPAGLPPGPAGTRRPRPTVDLVCAECGYGIAGREPLPPLCAMCHAEGAWMPAWRPFAERVPGA